MYVLKFARRFLGGWVFIWLPSSVSLILAVLAVQQTPQEKNKHAFLPQLQCCGGSNTKYCYHHSDSDRWYLIVKYMLFWTWQYNLWLCLDGPFPLLSWVTCLTSLIPKPTFSDFRLLLQAVLTEVNCRGVGRLHTECLVFFTFCHLISFWYQMWCDKVKRDTHGDWLPVLAFEYHHFYLFAFQGYCQQSGHDKVINKTKYKL